ncbi:MAG TPA: type II toxin-antitoxin system RelE/ParE family toxin [Polyangiaceae bacterium]|nr:type II toxin-antitoxin system RelE/ParE family toxin [Polyangiaceae bacterium]
MKLVLAPRFVREAERCAGWWRKNRPAARFLFDDELRVVLNQIRTAPQLGTAYVAMASSEHLRVLMPRTRHHVYYRILADQVRVVSVWGATRERGPRLR